MEWRRVPGYSKLQTPEPEPLHCTEQWGEEFEVWE